MIRYPRDLRGHGPNPPDAQWPGGARIAVQFVLNYEEGGESCLLHGDAASEGFLSDIPGAQPWPGQRHWNMESIYDYGARAGFWRLHRLFTRYTIPLTIYGVATALARSPEHVSAMKDAGWEIASHGLKWIDHKDMAEDDERAAIAEAVRLHQACVGEAPRGWYTGRCSMNTMHLVAEHGGFDYISDTYDDDLPYWRMINNKPQLVIPYTLEANDMRFSASPGWVRGDDFGTYLRDTFDVLYEEGTEGCPKMMTVGLHCRLIGRPGKMAGLKRFLDYIARFEDVWCPRRIDIARHWMAHHPAPNTGEMTGTSRPSALTKDDFIARFGGIFEHSPWIAERAHGLELGPAHDCAEGVHQALCRVFRTATDDERLGVLNAHPDLAGKLAAAGRLTTESASEQASAGLDHLTDEERVLFQDLNTRYMSRFGFPFIIAVRAYTKASILEAFHQRLEHGKDSEFLEACRQVERIAFFRLSDLFGDNGCVSHG